MVQYSRLNWQTGLNCIAPMCNICIHYHDFIYAELKILIYISGVRSYYWTSFQFMNLSRMCRLSKQVGNITQQDCRIAILIGRSYRGGAWHKTLFSCLLVYSLQGVYSIYLISFINIHRNAAPCGKKNLVAIGRRYERKNTHRLQTRLLQSSPRCALFIPKYLQKYCLLNDLWR